MEAKPKQTILIVDDESMNLLALNKILSSEYAVFFAKSGEEALALVAKNKPNLILLDVLMPTMSGFEVLSNLKKDAATADIPVIFITGLSDNKSEEQGFALGAVDYVRKPFSSTIVKARVNTHMNIMDQMHQQEELSRTDPLTGLPNRRRFDEHLELEWKRCAREKKPVSFLMLDLDKFKTYNDTYGHPQGDILLKAAAGVFLGAARRPADLVARLGGEEFGVLLPDTNLTAALFVAEKIRSRLEAVQIPTADGDLLTSSTVSIGGVSVVPGVGDAVADFIAQADANLYKAKEAGRNRIFPRLEG